MSSRIGAKIASSVFWKFLERGVFAVVQFVVQVVLARLLVPEDFGALAIMLAFTNVGIIVTQSGLNTALVQDPDVSERDYSTVFWICLTMSLALFAIMLVCAPVIARAFGNMGLCLPLCVMSSALVVNSFTSVAMARLMRRMDFKAVFIASASAVVVSGIAGVSCAFGGWGLWALVVQQVGYYVVLSVPLAACAGWRPHAVFDSYRAETLFSFGWKLLAASLIEGVYQSLVDLLVGKRFDSYSLGVVSQGKRWPQAVGYLLDGSIQPVALSSIAKVQDDAAEVKQLVRKVLCAYTFLMFPLMALLAACAEPVVLLLLGEQWLPCAPFIRIFCITYAMLPLNTTNLQAISALGRSDVLLKLEVAKKAYSVVLLLFAAFAIGDLYAIVATYAIAGVISLFVNAAPTSRLCGYGIAEQLRDVAPALAASCAAAALALLVSMAHLPTFVTLACQILVAGGAYVGISMLFGLEGLGLARQAFASLANRETGGDDGVEGAEDAGSTKRGGGR